MKPLGLEVYVFQNDLEHDAFVNNYRQYATGMLENKALAAAGFQDLVHRRYPGSNNKWMTDPDKYPRNVIIRYPPQGESTIETRRIGLDVLANFFLDKSINRYPPKEIIKADFTDVDDYPALDEFLMDDEIESAIKHDMDEDVLNEAFYRNYTAFASKCWSSGHVSDYAKTLGFPV